MKYSIRFLLCLCTLLVMAEEYAQAAIYSINYTGTFVSILDADGNTGGSFSPGAGVSVGDTYSGNFSFDTDQAVSDPSTLPPGSPPNVANYDFGVTHPSLTINGIRSVNLSPKIGLSIADNGDATTAILDTFFVAGLRELGFDPLPTSADFATWFTDVTDFDSSTGTGSEIILMTFDPSGSAFSGTGIPNPLTPLSNSFFIYLESVNGATQAAGLGLPGGLSVTPVPVPAAVWLFGSGLLGLVGVARRKKA